MTPEQVRAQMVDYLYGELSEERRRAFEAALAESESHRRELAALERTLGLARSALASELSQDPPAAVRARVLSAAREAARSAPAASPFAEAGEKRGFWALLRAPWLYPAVGFAAALAIVIVIDRRERASEAGPQPVEPPVSAPASDTTLSESKVEEQARPAKPAGGELGGLSREPSAPEGEALAAANKRSAGRARARREEPEGAATGAAKSASRAPRREYAAPPPAARRPERSFEAESKAVPFPGSAQDDDAEGSTKGGAARERARPATATRPSDEQRSAPAAAPSADSLERAPRGGGGPRPTSAPSAAASARPEEEVAAESTRDLGAAPDEAVAAPEPLVQRANEQLQDGLFAQSAKSYRELLRRFPRDPRAVAWRRALARAERALRADAGETR